MANMNSARALVSAAALAVLSPLAVRDAAGQAAPAVAPPGAKADDANADLPIRSIILYRSGVGYFERQGSVQGEQRASLAFKTEQINDILKSMVLLDLDGGRVNAVTYNSKEPLSRRLASFGLDISGMPGTTELLAKARGSRVTIVGPEGEIAGTILGVEERPVILKSDRGDTTAKMPFVNLVTSAGIRGVMTSSIVSFTFADAQLNEDLGKALAALAEQRTENVKAVDLSFSGEANKLRRVVVGYIHEMPVWKTSYRLVLPDEAKDKAGEKANFTLQGWAIVENTTDQDWKNVRLSLASGRPVSFTMDLYEPLFTPRPEVAVPVLSGVMPRVYESATNRQSMRFTTSSGGFQTRREAPAEFALSAPARDREVQAPAAAKEAVFGSDDDFVELGADDFAAYAAQAQASAGVAGETFMYSLDAPVTLERQRSAMLPILTTPVEGRRVSIYNPAAFPKHPMRGVQFTNNADLHLMPGPISVLDGAAYAGDAQIPHTSRGQQRLLSYSVDLDVLGATEQKATNTVVKVKIVDGLVEMSRKVRQQAIYTLTNNDSKRGRLVLVEHPKVSGWDLIEPAKPAETTENLYRFETPIEAGKSASLSVVQEQTQMEQIGLVNVSLDQLLIYAKDGKTSPAVIDAVKKAAAMQAKVSEIAQRLARVEEQRQEISGDQSRIRNNMTSIDRNSELYRRYTTKLNEQESVLEKLAAERIEAEEAKNAAEKELRDYLRDLDVE